MGRVLETRRRREQVRKGPAALPDLTRLAAKACTTPIAVIRLHETSYAHFESHFGIENSCDWQFSFPFDDAASALVVSDTRTDSRLSGHPVVTGEPWVRALAGAAIEDAAGCRLGAIFVADTVVRKFSAEQLGMLSDLAHQLSLGLQREHELRGLRDELAVSRSDALVFNDIRRLMEGVLTHADAAMYASDLDGRVLLANPATHRMLSREAGQLVGERVADLLSGEAARDFAEHDAYVADRGRRRLFAESAPHPDGSQHAYLATKFPLVDDDGRVYAVAGVSTDVTELLDTRTALAATEQRWQALVDDAPVAVMVVDAHDGRLRYANRQAASLCGLALPSDLTGCAFADFVPPAGKSELTALLAQAGRAGEAPVRSAPLQLAPVDGAVRHVTVNAVATRFNDRPAIQFAIQDVTAERAVHSELVASASFQHAVLAASPDVIYVMEVPAWRPMWASGNLLRTLGFPEGEEVIDTLREELVHPEDRERLQAVNEASLELADGQATQLRFRCATNTGDYRWFTRRLTPFARDDAGAIVQVLAIARDITDSVQAEDRLARAALHDPLTGLPNRSLLSDRLTSALHRARRAGTEVAVLCCGLDGFKHVNEFSGHSAGDGVLLTTAARLSAELRPQDTIARVGGDEFVIVLEPAQRTLPNGLLAPADIPDPRSDALAVAARIKRALMEPIELGEQGHVVTASIGITFARPDEGAEEALRDADSAMYRAKALGKDRCEIFNTHLRAEAVQRGRVEQLLRAALAAKLDPERVTEDPFRCPTPALWVAYQPITDLATGRVCGVEALARLTDGQRVPISPEEFIPIAEETGLIGPLGRFVLEQACLDVARWPQDIPLGVSVNLSARQAGLTGLVEQVEAALQSAGIAPAQLTLELTETALLEAGQTTMSALHALRALGVQISIDDFGTGYASLRYLTQLPVTGVKVDRSFTMGLPDDPTSNAIVQSVAGLARELGLTCVVEGIETVKQLHALPKGVQGQGFLLGRPATAKETGRFLLSRGAADCS